MQETKPIIYLEWITRDMLRDNPEGIYVFGDNVARKGFGGQAAEMRGEPNAIGVATKRHPSNTPLAFFHPDNDGDRVALESDLNRVVGYYLKGFQIYAPKAGLGTERARLKEKAPVLFNLIIDTFRQMSGEDFPW